MELIKFQRISISKTNLFRHMIFLILNLTVHQVRAETSVVEQNIKFYLGYVEVNISKKPILKIEKPCYVQIESINTTSLSDPSPIVRLKSYLTLEHISQTIEHDKNKDNIIDEDVFYWINTPEREAQLGSRNNINFYRYRAIEPTSVEPYRDINVLLDENLIPYQFGVSYWHKDHPDNIECKNLIEQQTEEEIEAFFNASPVDFFDRPIFKDSNLEGNTKTTIETKE